MNYRIGKMYLLTIMLVTVCFIFSSCGDDDPVGPQVPAGFNATATIYKGVMGTSSTTGPEIAFTYGSADKSPIAGTWVVFEILSGDGTLISDSAQTDANGKAVCGYSFNGALGYAEIQAMIRNIDTLTVDVRANTLIPGNGGQAQYILFDDKRSDIIALNGEPERVDVPFQNYWLLVAVYESTHGLAFVFNDVDTNQIWSEADEILEMIVNGIYTGKTKDSIGIGSTIADFTAIYGSTPPVYDSEPPPAWLYDYDAYGIAIWTDSAQTEIIEIHIDSNGTPPPSSLIKREISISNR